MIRISTLKLAAIAAGLAGLSLSCATFVPAQANPFFAQQTGRDCVSCHVPGQEQRGVQGLNATGQAFKNCGFKFDCGGSGAPPAAAGQKTTQSTEGYALFRDNRCGPNQGARYVIIRMSGWPENPFKFTMERGGSIRIYLTQGTTYASGCGSFPSNEGPWNYAIIEQ